MTFKNILIKTLLLSTLSFAYFNFISSSPMVPAGMEQAAMDSAMKYFMVKDQPVHNFFVKSTAEHMINSAPFLLDKVFKLTAMWVENHYPLASSILQGAKLLPKSEVAQIPGSGPFLEIINETVSHHNRTHNNTNEKLQAKDKKRDYSNFTIEEVLDDLKDNHNISLSQIPFSKAVDVTKLANVPGLQDLVKDAVTTNINGTPFAITLLELVNHIKGEVKLQDFSNHTVLEDIKKNVSSVMAPFIKLQTKIAFEKLANHSGYGEQYKAIKGIVDRAIS